MINVSVNKQDERFLSLEVKGHAGSGPYGRDLVCAAISAVLTGGFNAIESKKNFNFKLAEGDAQLIAKGPLSNHDEVVVATILTSLKTIAESNPKFIKIKFN